MPAAVPMLAENFAPLWTMIFGGLIVLTALAGVSFAASVRGRWTGPVMAAPAVRLGLLLFFAFAAVHGPCGLLMLALVPAALGIVSIGVWAEKRKQE